MTESWSRDRQTALHEAGHAVVANLLGVEFVGVSIGQRDHAGVSLLGHVEFLNIAPGTPRVKLVPAVFKILMAIQAGPDTQTRWYQRLCDKPETGDLTREWFMGKRVDDEAARRLVEEHLPDQSAGMYHRARHVLGAAIEASGDRYWILLDRLADALVAAENKTLTFAQINSVLSPYCGAVRSQFLLAMQTSEAVEEAVSRRPAARRSLG